MSAESQENGVKKRPAWLDLSLYLRREPVTIALLTALAIVFFLFVTGLSRMFYAQQASLAQRWSDRGTADLQARRYAAAVTDFRTALLYARDDYSYRLNLAEALLGERHTDEAYAYLVNLWDRQPENGLVNLELARIAASRGETARAQRFYHNAIYATWPGDQETASRNARLELIDYLLRIQTQTAAARTQAQAELIALAASLSDDAPEQVQLGQLFLRVGDNEHALSAFRLALRPGRHNQAALAGAGAAALNLGLYPTAQRYLQEAVAMNAGDQQSAAYLHMTEVVLQLDPFRPQIAVAERNRIVVHAFAVAGGRLKACPTQGGAEMQSLTQQWNRLRPRVTERGLRQDPDLVSTAMQLSFSIERQAGTACGAPGDADEALLRIANLREEN